MTEELNHNIEPSTKDWIKKVLVFFGGSNIPELIFKVMDVFSYKDLKNIILTILHAWQFSLLIIMD